MHRISPYIWWFPCKRTLHIHHIYLVLANPTIVLAGNTRALCQTFEPHLQWRCCCSGVLPCNLGRQQPWLFQGPFVRKPQHLHRCKSKCCCRHNQDCCVTCMESSLRPFLSPPAAAAAAAAAAAESPPAGSPGAAVALRLHWPHPRLHKP